MTVHLFGPWPSASLPGRVHLAASTIVHADRIIVMEQGRIAEEGTHAELIARNGLYASMWARQRQAEQAREQLAQALEQEAEVVGKERPKRATLVEPAK